jgi:hypothetical protein
MRTINLLSLLFLSFFVISCDKTTEELATDKPTDYFQFQPGKSITYRLDSTVFTLQGRNTEIHSYQEKHVVDSEISDNLGRKSYRVFRFIRDLTGTQPWAPSGSYFITPVDNTIEVIENNLRILKLVGPIKEGKAWKGNNFLSNEPYETIYNFDNDDEMYDWDYTIDEIDGTISLNNKTIENVITINVIDESFNVPITDPNTYASKSFLSEKYAKNIGLIYQEYELWEYQPNPGGSPYKNGFGVKRTMLDYN